MNIKKLIAAKLKLENIESLIEIPPNQELGDFALPCFKLTKIFNKEPIIIAKEIARKLSSEKMFSKVETKGAYVNMFIEPKWLSKKVLNEILIQKDRYGSNESGKNKTALIEHTSINPNTSPHMGRARNAIIGDAIAKIHKFAGYRTEVHYFVNDIGKQIALLVYASRDKKLKFKDMLKLYINANKELTPEKEKEVFKLLHELEQGKKEIKIRFKSIVRLCIEGQKELLNEFGIKYDFFDYESKYLWNNATKKILKQLENTGKLIVDEEGRKVLNLEGYGLPMKSPYLVLTRADGTSLYVLRDIAYTIYKAKRGKDVNLIVLGEDHKLYIEQFKVVLSLLGEKAPVPVYYAYVLLTGKGKMSTRQGTLVLLEEVMAEALKKAKKEILEKHGKVKDLNKRARKIAYGAIKFAILKVSAEKNVSFNMEEALSFEGESGPYIQYAYTRAKSILRKAGKINVSIKKYNLKHKAELSLMKSLAEFPLIVNKVLESYQTHILAHYLLELAKTFNEFYHTCQCLVDNLDKSVRDTRLTLVKASSIVLKNGLNLLGIETLERM